MRSQFGTHFWWISLFSVFIGQSIFMFLACLPLYGALVSPRALCATDVLGVSMCVSGVLLELIADRQMDAFQDAKKQRVTAATVIDRGLWLYSRHPNYLGEMTWWWGIYLFGLHSDAPAWVAIGPLGITFLFNFISVKLLEDRQLANKGDAFRGYQRRVPSALLPLPNVLRSRGS
jgi:steroid 5-alpha reductase family enzyme